MGFSLPLEGKKAEEGILYAYIVAILLPQNPVLFGYCYDSFMIYHPQQAC